MAFPNLKTGQHATGFATGGSTTYSATLPSGATAGNLILFAIGGDKDIGTITLSGFSKPVDLRSPSASVSLVLAYATASGGETVISATGTGANTAGSNVYVGEFEQTGSGAWTLVATTGLHNSDESNVTIWSSGTTGTSTADGLAVAAWAADSVNTAGTVTYSNSFAEISGTGNGSTQAGLWVATQSISSGNTAESTITRTGGTADQHSGGIIIFARSTTLTVVPGGIASGEAFGSATLLQTQFVVPGGVASAAAFGSGVVTTGLTIAGTGIASAETFGAPRVANFPRVKQTGWNFTPGGETTIGSSFDEQTATAGNLIVFCLSAHKDIGTFTLDGSGWHYPVNLRSADVSTVIAWKVAAGGEFTISGTVTSGNETGSNALVIEVESPIAGQWAEMGVANTPNSGSNVTDIASGTTPASTGDGLAFATFSVDNILSDSVDTYSNGYTDLFSQGWGQFEAGLWVADHTVPFGTTTSSTLHRAAPVTARKMSAGVVVLGRAASQAITTTGIASAEAFGTTTVFGPITPTGITSAEAFGSATVARGVLVITPGGIPSAEAFGSHNVHSGPILQPSGIATAEAFGSPTVANGVHRTFIGGVTPGRITVGGVNAKVYIGGVLAWQ